MSRRKMNFDLDQLRSEEYKNIDADLAQEAVWEAMERLNDQNIDIGPKAARVLERRQKIKQKIPKMKKARD